MMTKALPSAALFALALLVSAVPAWESASAQEVAAARAHAGGRTTAGGARLLKRMSLSVGESAHGSRVRITSDAPLEGFETFTEGGRFFVLVPEADAALLTSGGLAASGFTRVETAQRGDDALIAFTLAPGVAPRVRASFNRLEILFAAQSGQTPASGGSQSGGGGGASATPTPTPEAVTPPGTGAEGAAAGTAQPPGAPGTPPGTSAARLKALLTPEKVNPVRIPRFESAPVIDGKLDEEVWKQAAVFKDFYQVQPGDNIAPTQPTEVLVGYDSKTFYFAFRAYDDPTKVRATVPKRDQIFEDDHVGMYLDTFNDQRRAYELFFNPLGVQADGILTEGGGEDFSPDIVMESKGAITSDGYVVEVAVPFKSLRYEAGKGKLWGLHLFRRIKRANNELDSWMPLSRDISGWLVQAGRITGLEGISTERTLELIPSVTLSQTGRRVRAFPPQPSPAATGPAPADPGRFVNPPVRADIGVTAKYSLTPTVTLDFAYNPDFAQVEADATVITANQRFPIFFEEKRPFFLEGKEIFDTNNMVVHTRAIIDPDFAAKLTGKRGRNTFGLILASDAAPGNFGEDELDERRRAIATESDPEERRRKAARLEDLLTNIVGRNALVGVMRFKRDVGKESSVGFFGTTYNFAERHNHLLGFDGRFKVNPTTVASFEVVGTTLSDCGREFSTGELRLDCFNRKGFAYSGAYDVTGRHMGWIFSVGGRTRDYRADVGFTRRTNTNNLFYAFRWNTEPRPKAKLIQFRLQNFTGLDYDWQGRSQSWFDGTNFDFTFARQTWLRIGTNFGYERLFAEEFGGRFAGEDQERQKRHRTIFFVLESTLSKEYSGFVFVGTQRGQFDFDFGAGPRFPRVSLSALAQREAQAAGLCDVPEGQTPPSACLGLQDPGAGKTFDVQAGFNYQPTSALRATLSYNKSRLTRYDTGLVAFDANIYVLRATYQFTRFVALRARVDYDTLASRARGQFLFGWTPNPGTAFYAGYNDDLNRNGFNPFNGNLEPGFRRNGRTFFVKASYLFRRSFGQ